MAGWPCSLRARWIRPADLAEDVQRLFDDLAKRRPDRRHVVAGECMPVVDVFETERDGRDRPRLPGVAADASAS